MSLLVATGLQMDVTCSVVDACLLGLEFQPGVSGLTWCIAQDADSEVQRGEFTGSTLQMGSFRK